MKILIVRHAEPDYAHDNLTEKGKKEAALLAQRMNKIKDQILGIYISPLGRAQATANATLELTGLKGETLPWLHEFRGVVTDPCGGRLSGAWDWMPQYWTNSDALFSREQWMNDPLIRSGNSEQIYNETIKGLDALLERHGYHRKGMIFECEHGQEGSIVLFCHSAIGMVMLSHMLGVAPTVFLNACALPTGSVTTLVTEERIPGQAFFRLFQMGDTSHLYAADEPLSHCGLYRETAHSEGLK